MSVWSLCVCCLWAGWILGGGCAGVGVNSEITIDDSKTVKECRVHIEKALEEYWDKTEPSTDAPRSNIQLDSKPFQEEDNDKKEETPCVGETNCDQNDISESNISKVDEITETDNDDDDDDDDDDEDENTESPGDDTEEDATEGTDTTDSDASTNDPQNVESESETTETEESNEAETTETEESNEAETKQVEESDELPSKSSSSETKAPGGGAHETRRVYVVKNLNKEPIEFDDLKIDKVDEGKREDSTGEPDKTSDVDDDDDDDEEDDDDDETDDNEEEEAVEDDDGLSDKIEEDKVTSEEPKDEGKQEDKEASREETSTVEEVKVPEAAKTSESSGSDIISDQNKLQIDSSKEQEEEAITATEIKPSVVISSSVEPSQLVTETPEVPKTPEVEIPEVIAKRETPPELPAKEELIENIYEDEDDDDDGLTYRNRDHIDAILGLDEVGTELEKEEEKLAQTIFKDIKRIELSHIKPMELLYKFADSTTRSLGDAEIFNKPMILFLGPWNAGKSSIINYILGIERTTSALETGTGITDVDFTVISHGPQRRVISGTELATDWRYSGVQKFGQGFLDHFRSIHIPHALLQKVTIIDTPGILENRKTAERGYSLNDAFQWFIDRADAIYVVLDPNKVDIGGELSAVIDQLKGREVRFVLNKADSIRRSDLMRVVGQLFWNLSPLMSGSEAPVIYAVSLTTHPYHPSAPTRFLDDQEKNLLYDMRSTLDRRVENRILYARKHAVKVRNHAKMVDCYLATFYRHKSIFSNKRNVAKQIIENPGEYSIYDGIGSMTNVSRYDLPSPAIYKDFFRTHALYDFKPLASTCSYFRGCPMDKLDEAIAKDIPELMARYKKAKIAVQEVGADGNR